MDSAPSVNAPAPSSTKRTSPFLISVFEDHPSSTVDIVVICSHLALLSQEYRKQQDDCCERLKAAKIPARILTFIYDAVEFESSYIGRKAATILYQSLSSEREASGKTKNRIIFISTHLSEFWVIPVIKADGLALDLESPVEGIKVSSVHSASIVHSTIGILHFPPSQYTYRQRVLETAILVFLQYVGVIVLHCSEPSAGCSISSSQSPLFLIGFVINMIIFDSPSSRIPIFWFGLEAIFWVFQDSSYMRIIDSVLRYTTLGFFPIYYSCLAVLQLMVDHHDQLRWLFPGVSIVAVIKKHRLSSTRSFVGPQGLLIKLALAITASMLLISP
ncbi:hypothetical protein J3E74DRAFT_286062 [Bipolaris maydis]|nr:hypothetical protein J3E74DRAFT_286062 [Bipolaris maydis]